MGTLNRSQPVHVIGVGTSGVSAGKGASGAAGVGAAGVGSGVSKPGLPCGCASVHSRSGVERLVDVGAAGTLDGSWAGLVSSTSVGAAGTLDGSWAGLGDTLVPKVSSAITRSTSSATTWLKSASTEGACWGDACLCIVAMASRSISTWSL